ncbi:hypothetical protein PoB_002613600 [Plakobranchus ocellatus]|uniref:Uncharacterized protein n=1 Tax=Plakobranchus ocellatus TaxID=259542 RepID=A0AAV3ZUL0_9GAST|nr:hypothetical protein PoB_002613600 [Plakobranchus ocellatus]
MILTYVAVTGYPKHVDLVFRFFCLLINVHSLLALFAGSSEDNTVDLGVGRRDFSTVPIFYLNASWSEGKLARRMIWGRVGGRAISILNICLLSSADKSALRCRGFEPRHRALA